MSAELIPEINVVWNLGRDDYTGNPVITCSITNRNSERIDVYLRQKEPMGKDWMPSDPILLTYEQTLDIDQNFDFNLDVLLGPLKSTSPTQVRMEHNPDGD